MASVVTLPITLGAPPAGYTKPATSGKLSAPKSLQVYPAGPSFIASARRQILLRTFAEDDKAVESSRAASAAAAADGAGEALYPGLGEEPESKELLASDPKEWKKQDHYAVLGLGNLRYKATDDQIRVAPQETLTNPERRRQFDSVDWNIEDEVPDLKKIPVDQFCDVLGPIFAREARFSKVQPVPAFGGPDASKKEVEGFYDFWYNFDSWRSFEWHDKEVNEGSDSRDDKRFTEKKNKSERTRRKKEDNTRLRTLIDEVLALDPRIKRIKAEEKAARDAKKKGGVTGGPAKPLTPAQKKAAEDKRKAEEAAQAAAEKKNAEASKADREAAKKAKEAARKNLKKWKKSIATVITSSNYFQPSGTSPSATTVEKQLGELDTLCELLEPEEVKDLKEQVESAGTGEPAKAVLVGKVKGLGDKADGKFTEFA